MMTDMQRLDCLILATFPSQPYRDLKTYLVLGFVPWSCRSPTLS